MPIFQYKCPDCNHVQDEYHGINSESAVLCKDCGKPSAKQFIPTSNFLLTGGDWPTQGMKMKSSMSRKNNRMKGVMKDREAGGEAVKSVGDLKRVQR